MSDRMRPVPAPPVGALPRRRGRWLRVWVPALLGGAFGISSFLLLAVASLIGGGGILTPLLAGAGVGLVVGGGLALLLRDRGSRPMTPDLDRVDLPAGTRAVLARTVASAKPTRRRLARLRRRRLGLPVAGVLQLAESLLHRIAALVDSPALQSRHPSDADVMMLEGMSTRYIPDLVSALEDSSVFLGRGSGRPRERAEINVRSVEEQLTALSRELDRMEHEAVGRVSRDLEVHSEFLRLHLPQQGFGTQQAPGPAGVSPSPPPAGTGRARR